MCHESAFPRPPGWKGHHLLVKFLIPVPSSAACVASPESPSPSGLWSSHCNMRGLGEVRTQTLQLVSRSLRQGGNF